MTDGPRKLNLRMQLLLDYISDIHSVQGRMKTFSHRMCLNKREFMVHSTGIKECLKKVFSGSRLVFCVVPRHSLIFSSQFILTMVDWTYLTLFIKMPQQPLFFLSVWCIIGSRYSHSRCSLFMHHQMLDTLRQLPLDTTQFHWYQLMFKCIWL